MPEAADFHFEDSEGRVVAVLTGDWTAVEMGNAPDRLADALSGRDAAAIDLTRVGRCDTSGAFGVLRAVRQVDREPGQIVAPPDVDRLLKVVEAATKATPTQQQPRRFCHDIFDRLGRAVYDIGGAAVDTNVFTGHLLVAVGRAIRNPRRIRWAAIFSLAERAGLDAIPIVSMTTFFIGAVVGLLGANLLRQFGAQVFAVELIGVSVLREFNVLITALLLAGRSASAFAAEIGSMKMNQEIDAMQVLGVDPFDALVFPRFMALLVTIPLLVFVASLAGLFGGLVVSTTILGLSPTVFFQRMVDNVGITHFWVGMSKAPVMAVVIAAIGCRQGLDVGGDVESLGRHVTSAVVQAIFSAIMIDAVFALIYMKLNV
jgi:phospholipid/cholesterol/gamma-HCH transport system permease protein